jgi:hypothetical protein
LFVQLDAISSAELAAISSAELRSVKPSHHSCEHCERLKTSTACRGTKIVDIVCLNHALARANGE